MMVNIPGCYISSGIYSQMSGAEDGRPDKLQAHH